MSICRYCNTGYEGMADKSIMIEEVSLGIMGEGDFRADIICDGDKGYTMDICVDFEANVSKAVRIEYCPMCGRKLHDKEWQEAAEYWKKHDEEIEY